MTTIFLVRHAAHDLLGRVLTGRIPGVSLGAEGLRQSAHLAERLSQESISAVQTSPLERARETAGPIAARLGIKAECNEALTEIDYGAWSGMTFDALDADTRWATWNRAKAVHRPPGGESLLEVQCRAVSCIGSITKSHPNSGAVLVSHCDVIKAILAYYLGLAIEGISRFEIGPASITTISVNDWGAKVLGVNEMHPA
jgi:probable phosphoglycerate mutase